jgi:hypothetical protein
VVVCYLTIIVGRSSKADIGNQGFHGVKSSNIGIQTGFLRVIVRSMTSLIARQLQSMIQKVIEMSVNVSRTGLRKIETILGDIGFFSEKNRPTHHLVGRTVITCKRW